MNSPFPRQISADGGASDVGQATELPDGLIYVSDADPGIRRRRSGKGFAYRGPDGTPLSKDERDRVVRLGIPPAYTDVWICPRPDGHLQATGLDQRGRKQYCYHPEWGTWRSDTKYTQLAAFGAALPALRRRMTRDLLSEAGDMAFSLAALVLLLDRAYLRIGNQAYTAQNRTFGATTLLNRHLTLVDGTVKLRFVAKGGKKVQHTLRDRRLHRIMQEIGDLPGRNLFTYLDEDGATRTIGSQDVNSYLAGVSGISGISAKTFRTWGGSLAAFEAATGASDNLTVKMMAEAAADRLANTPAISRSSYIHPSILELAALETDKRLALLDGLSPVDEPHLQAPERRMLAFLNRG
jgi:DNA topoisomerase I